MGDCGIYVIKNKINGKIYVGSSLRISQRWNEHRRQLRLKIHHSVKLQHAWDKHGEDSFLFEIIEICNSGDLFCKEQFCIDFLKPEYNISLYADRPPPPPNKPIVRVDLVTGEEVVYRTRDEAAACGFNEGEVTACCLGRAGSHLGYGWKFQGEELPLFNKTEVKKRVVRINSSGETVEFDSIVEAAALGFSASSISACCLGKQKTHGGFGWKFKDWDSGRPLLKKDKHGNMADSRLKPVVGTDILSGETKFYESLSLTLKDGFSPAKVGACCLGRRKTHMGYRWEYADIPSKEA